MEPSQTNSSFDHFVEKLLNVSQSAAEVDYQFRRQVEKVDDLFLSELFDHTEDCSLLKTFLTRLKESLLCLVSNRNVKLIHTIETRLDWRQQRMPPDLSDFILNVINSHSGPCRTHGIEQVAEGTDKWLRIFDILSATRKDMANYCFQPVSYLERQSAVLERSKFAQLYFSKQEVGSDGLASTKLWLTEAFLQNKDESSSNILTAAYLNLLALADSPLPHTPEVVHKDMRRLQYISDNTLKLCLFCTIIDIVLSLCNDKGEDQARTVELNLLSTAKKTFHESVSYGSMMEKFEETISVILDLIGSVLSPFRNISLSRHAIYSRLMNEMSLSSSRAEFVAIYKQVQDLFRGVMRSESMGQCCQVSLLPVCSELLNLACYFSHFTKYNILTFGPLFDEIIFDLRDRNNTF